MIDALQLRHEIIRPVLKYLEPEIPYSMAAENLLMGTCATESLMGQFLVQCDCGPAKGIFQMEPATHDDIWTNFLEYRRKLLGFISDLQQPAILTDLSSDVVGNLYYAAAMCRVHYFRVKFPLPDGDDVTQLAHYWKLHYNTHLGAGTIEKFIGNYARYVA